MPKYHHLVAVAYSFVRRFMPPAFWGIEIKNRWAKKRSASHENIETFSIIFCLHILILDCLKYYNLVIMKNFLPFCFVFLLLLNTGCKEDTFTPDLRTRWSTEDNATGRVILNPNKADIIMKYKKTDLELIWNKLHRFISLR